MSALIVSFVLLILAAWYVPFRMKKLIGAGRIWLWQLLALLFLAGYPLFMTLAYFSAHPIATGAYNLYGLLFVFYVGLFFFLLIAHLLAPWLKKIPGKYVVAVCAVASSVYVGIGFVQAQSFRLTAYVLPVKNLPGPVSIVHISDLHLGPQRGKDYLEKVIDAVNEIRPDLVLINGDLVDGNIALDEKLFSRFNELKGEKYFTLGNHEYYVDTPKALGLISGAGFRILNNETVETHGFQLIGLQYMNADRKTRDPHQVNDLTMEEELPRIKRDPGRPSVLMHHSPVGLEYIAQGQVDVMLSGHTHGGQFFPITLLNEVIYPLNKGLRQTGDTTFLVSQGAGTFGPWLRLGTFNEIQWIRLIPA